MCFVALNVLYWVAKATWIKNPTTNSKFCAPSLIFGTFWRLALSYSTSSRPIFFFEEESPCPIDVPVYISRQVQYVLKLAHKTSPSYFHSMFMIACGRGLLLSVCHGMVHFVTCIVHNIHIDIYDFFLRELILYDFNFLQIMCFL